MTDLITWKFEALVFNHTQIAVPPAGLPGGNPPVLPFRIERPKVIYNAATKMYVLVVPNPIRQRLCTERRLGRGRE